MDPINNSSSATATPISESTVSAPAAPMADPEAMIAAVAMKLEDSTQRSRDAQRRTRSLRTEARRGAIRKQRRSAAARLVGTVVNSAAQIASGAVQIGAAASSTANKTEVAEYRQAHPHTGPQPETTTPGVENGAGLDAPSPSETAPIDRSSEIMKAGEGYAQMIGAAGGALQGAAELSASTLSADAEAKSLAAEEYAEHAEARGDAAESAERFADKALGHQEAIARARHDAAMAALRG